MITRVKRTRRGGPDGAAALFLAMCAAGAAFLPVSISLAAPRPGDLAPALKLRDLRGELRSLDFATSGPTLLIFAKPGDRHTSDVLHTVEDLLLKQPHFRKSLSRWVVLSRLDPDAKGAQTREFSGSGWPVLLDETDAAYRAYRIVATPTAVLVGRGGRVEAVNPGYDLDMENYLRTEIARVTSVTLPTQVGKPSKARMYLRMGQRMAARGLWEQALSHYQEAVKAEPLSPEDELDLARILIELRQLDSAEGILKKLQGDPRLAQRVAPLMARLSVLKTTKEEPGQPPRVTR